MTADSRLLLCTVARKLEEIEFIAVKFLCRERFPDPGQLDTVQNAFDLMYALERQKVIDSVSNNWDILVDVLESKVVRRKDLAKLVSNFGE